MVTKRDTTGMTGAGGKAVKLGVLTAAVLASIVAASPAASAHVIPDGPAASVSGGCWHKPVLPPWCMQ